MIQERLSREGRSFWKPTQTHLEEFGKEGLRTLCLAYRSTATRLLLPVLASLLYFTF